MFRSPAPKSKHLWGVCAMISASLPLRFWSRVLSSQSMVGLWASKRPWNYFQNVVVFLGAFLISFSNGANTQKVKTHYSKGVVTYKSHEGKGKPNRSLWWVLHNVARNCSLISNILHLCLPQHTLHLYMWKERLSLLLASPTEQNPSESSTVSDLVLKPCSSGSFES